MTDCSECINKDDDPYEHATKIVLTVGHPEHGEARVTIEFFDPVMAITALGKLGQREALIELAHQIHNLSGDDEWDEDEYDI